MFKTNKKKQTAMSSNQSGKNLPSVNIVSKGTNLKGTLTTSSDVRIAGTFDGEAKSESKVIVSSTGTIIGNVEAADADIAGTIDGEVRVASKLILRKTALVEGDIYAKTLLVEEGAQINGACNMGEESRGATNGRSRKEKASVKHPEPKKEPAAV